ncbi:MAG TPA: hypothetical protein VNZ53_54625 [Steroidobacteraceae bacterium]|nr:hypothetical protein [Steroidobacteraceae bacterium]
MPERRFPPPWSIEEQEAASLGWGENPWHINHGRCVQLRCVHSDDGQLGATDDYWAISESFLGRRCSFARGSPIFVGRGFASADVNKPVIPPQPRTINLTQEQRFIIKENVKDLALSKAPKDAPETIGDPVPASIVLHTLPSEVGLKVSQIRSHMFFIKDDNNAIVLVSPNDRRVADVIH